MKIGYIRPKTTNGPDCEEQILSLQKAGCAHIIQATSADKQAKQQILEQLLEKLKPGDCLVALQLTSLAQTLKEAIAVIHFLIDAGIDVVSLEDNFDSSKTDISAVSDTLKLLANFEQQLIKERTQIGLQSAKARGRNGGRPRGLSAEAEKKAEQAEKLYLEGKLSAQQIADALAICKSTLYSYLRHRDVDVGIKPETAKKEALAE